MIVRKQAEAIRAQARVLCSIHPEFASVRLVKMLQDALRDMASSYAAQVVQYADDLDGAFRQGEAARARVDRLIAMLEDSHDERDHPARQDHH